MNRKQFVKRLHDELTAASAAPIIGQDKKLSKVGAQRIQAAMERIFLENIAKTGVMLAWPGFATIQGRKRKAFTRNDSLHNTGTIVVGGKTVLSVTSMGPDVVRVLNPYTL